MSGLGIGGDRILGPIAPDDVALTHGGQNAISLIFDCCLRGERPVVLIEDLAYPGFRYAARAARAEVVAVEIDEQGCPLGPGARECGGQGRGAEPTGCTGDDEGGGHASTVTARRGSRQTRSRGLWTTHLARTGLWMKTPGHGRRPRWGDRGRRGVPNSGGKNPDRPRCNPRGERWVQYIGAIACAQAVKPNS